MLKLIVFDCDGVMFDSKNANRKYYNFLLNHFGIKEMKEDDVDFVHIHSVNESIEHIFRNHPEVSLEEIHQLRAETGYAPFLKYMAMEPDLIDFLETVRQNYSLAISTNRTDTMIPLLHSYKLEHFFGKVMTAANAPRPKPAPDALLEILTYYNCRPEDTLFIGDSVIDEQHAASCNVDLIAFRNRELNGRYHVSSFMEILKLPPFKDNLSKKNS
ncbi:MAG: HAD family hydrolase [Deltaproteobacteria bacterium]|nr:HAD family hydrolase [Deltaproteobacteria bacterium]